MGRICIKKNYTINVGQKCEFVFGRVESIVGKGENADYQYFLLFPQCFSNAYLSRSIKNWDCGVQG